MASTAAPVGTIVLVGDVGGTNTTLALVAIEEDRFRLVDRFLLASQELPGIMQGIAEARRAFDPRLWQRIEACCFSAAGPIENNRCSMSNVRWEIDGNEIETGLGVPTRLINDFTGICHGIPILFRQSPDQFIEIPHSDGSHPAAGGEVIAVVGAGTGLGVGFLTTLPDGRLCAHPSEGGHSAFAAFDGETIDLLRFVKPRYEDTPGSETVLSGQGIVNILDFLSSRERHLSATVEQILALPPAERPPRIAAEAVADPTCRRTMELFVRIYGRFASSVALHVFATGGLFLAGGIAAKNQSWFLERNRFITAFEHNYKPSIRPILKRVPVHIVSDYNVSLYGAAYAAGRYLDNLNSREQHK